MNYLTLFYLFIIDIDIKNIIIYLILAIIKCSADIMKKENEFIARLIFYNMIFSSSSHWSN